MVLTRSVNDRTDKDDCDNLIEGLSTTCQTCGAPLCLRKQVINLALGFLDSMRCLVCIGRENEKEPEKILEDVKVYISTRDCFATQWLNYRNVSACPDPDGCFPDTCFREFI